MDIAGLLDGDLADLLVLSPDDLRAQGLAEAGELAAGRLAAGPGRFWIHLDVDVLDEAAMPATDYLMPDGLRGTSSASCLPPLCSSPASRG